MIYIQLLGGIGFIVVGLFFVLMNWIVVVRRVLLGKHSSWVPVLGGFLTSIGIILLPYQDLRFYWWIPFIIDFGSLPGLLFTVFYFAWMRIKHCQ